MFTVAAVICAALVSLPASYGSLAVLAATLLFLGIFLTIARSGGDNAKCFCFAAMIPLILALYSIGWGLGWAVYNGSTPDQVLSWFGSSSGAIKAVTLSAWLCGVFSGIVCSIIR